MTATDASSPSSSPHLSHSDHQRLIMAFDFGTQRMGVAIGQEMLRSARALKPIKARDGIPNWQTLETLISEWQPDLFVVGLPLNMDDTESSMSLRARKFGRRLKARFSREVVFVDERQTTQAAKMIARERGRKEGSYREDSVDGIAAEILLQNFYTSSQYP